MIGIDIGEGGRAVPEICLSGVILFLPVLGQGDAAGHQSQSRSRQQNTF